MPQDSMYSAVMYLPKARPTRLTPESQAFFFGFADLGFRASRVQSLGLDEVLGSRGLGLGFQG